jgi:hypothetical protein
MQYEMSAAFDTYEAAKEFEAAGFSEAQVESLLNVTRRMAVLPDISNLAAKADIVVVRNEMATKADIVALRNEMATKADIVAVRAEMATKAEVAELKGALIGFKSEVRADISTAKFQVVMATLAGMVAITTIGSLLSRLLR